MKIAIDPLKAPKWMLEAACANKDVTGEFFPQKGKSSTEARKICQTCLVAIECLDYAIAYDCEGIWGGLNHKERNRRYSPEIREIVKDDYFGG